MLDQDSTAHGYCFYNDPMGMFPYLLELISMGGGHLGLLLDNGTVLVEFEKQYSIHRQNK
jgi:hypothetical protein